MSDTPRMIEDHSGHPPEEQQGRRMRGTGFGIAGLAALMLAACGGQEEAAKTPETQAASAPAAAPAAEPAPVQTATVDDKLGIPDDNPETPQCVAGLKARGLKENELWVMLHTPDGICPNVGVEEARIREILAKDWEAAGCKVHTPKEMLRALESGACGGDAG